MMKNTMRCPKCRALLAVSVVEPLAKEKEILGILAARSDRIAYKAVDGAWYFTNSNDTMPTLDEKMLSAMLKSGALVHKYSDRSEGYCLPGQEYKPDA